MKSIIQTKRINSSFFVFMGLSIGIVVCILLVFLFQHIEENTPLKETPQVIDLESSGNHNVYVKDGLIVSFENVYYNGSLLALQVIAENNGEAETTIEATDEESGEKVKFNVKSYNYKYMFLDIAENESTNIYLKLYTKDKVLAEGFVTYTPQTAGSVFINNKDVYYEDENTTISYIGQDDQSHFFYYTNNAAKNMTAQFSAEGSEFSFDLKANTTGYCYISSIGWEGLSKDMYQITVIEQSEEITIEKVDGNE